MYTCAQLRMCMSSVHAFKGSLSPAWSLVGKRCVSARHGALAAHAMHAGQALAVMSCIAQPQMQRVYLVAAYVAGPSLSSSYCSSSLPPVCVSILWLPHNIIMRPTRAGDRAARPRPRVHPHACPLIPGAPGPRPQRQPAPGPHLIHRGPLTRTAHGGSTHGQPTGRSCFTHLFGVFFCGPSAHQANHACAANRFRTASRHCTADPFTCGAPCVLPCKCILFRTWTTISTAFPGPSGHLPSSSSSRTAAVRWKYSGRTA